jgi:acetylornithine deacetylase
MTKRLCDKGCRYEDRLRKTLDTAGAEMMQLLCESVKIASVSGKEGPFVRFIADWARQHGFKTDLWEGSESQLAGYPKSSQNHMPLVSRPTLVIELPSSGNGRSLIFNAHSDVVEAGDIKDWSVNPWGGECRQNRVYGRGACDAKGALIGALWAMAAIKESFPHGLPGRVMLELVPGEENCVGLGTLTSVVRGYRADAAIVLEPSENLPRCASRSGVRFEIVCKGKAAHGSVKWVGKDAIRVMRKVLDAIKRLEECWNDKTAEPLFAAYPVARPITVDRVEGGRWQGMVCDKCSCSGYLELLPRDDNQQWKHAFTSYLREEAGEDEIDIRFDEEYTGHETDPKDVFCAAAESVVKKLICERYGTALNWTGWSGFNSGCEAGLRAKMQNTATLVWGPGSLSQAHAVDEFIDFGEVELFAQLVSRLCINWSELPR